MSFINPTVDEFKTYFVRDFPYGASIEEHVLNADIVRAQADADNQIPIDLFEEQSDYNIGFNLLSAHYLVTNLRTSSQGLSGQFSWLQNSHGVAGVSESLAIPQDILNNPILAFLSKTNYGAQYLMMIYGKAIGNVFTVQGATTA